MKSFSSLCIASLISLSALAVRAAEPTSVQCQMSIASISCDANGNCFYGPKPPVTTYGPVALNAISASEKTGKVVIDVNFEGKNLHFEANGDTLDQAPPAPSFATVDITITEPGGPTLRIGGSNAAESFQSSQSVPRGDGGTNRSSLMVNCSLR